MYRDSVKGTGYPLNSPVSPLLTLPCVTVCHHISTGLYHNVEAIMFVVTACVLKKGSSNHDSGNICVDV